MSDKLDSQADPRHPMVYQIRLRGDLGRQWAGCFGDVPITPEDDGVTRSTGPVVEQAVLHGLLRKVRDLGVLGVPLISAVRVKPP